MAIKKKDEVRQSTIGYRIPQFEYNDEDFKTDDDLFKRSTAVSTMFGTDTKDTMYSGDIAGQGINARHAYDYRRDDADKKITKAELIEKYGTEFYEFDMISNEERKRVFGDDITINNNKVTEQEAVINEQEDSSLFIKSADDAIEEAATKEQESQEASFNFDQFKNDEAIENMTEQDEDLIFGSFKPKYDTSNYVPEEHTTIIRRQQEQPKPVEVKPEPVYQAPQPEPKYVAPEPPVAKPEPQPQPEPVYQAPKVEEAPKTVSDLNKYKNYKLPPRDIFTKGAASSGEIPQWVYDKEEIINQTLADFGIAGSVVERRKGPSFTRYEIALEAGVMAKKVSNIHNEIQMALGVKSINIQAPIPGKRTVGVEVPNVKNDTVFFGDILNDEFYDDNPLKIALGKDIDNNNIYTKINKWPHGLVAGSTGSGKSVCINTILLSLLLKNKPDELKLMLFDPKVVELMTYNELPHLVTPVITEPSLASEALKWACKEMDDRYNIFALSRSKNIEMYNEKVKTDMTLRKMPYIVIIIDELADLMMTAAADVEDSVSRITAKARAAGIHLLVATQRPTVDVVKGTIKANIPTRVAFHTVSPVDSVTILDEGGAENLLGKGDMLIKEGDIPQRLQGAYVPDDEIEQVTDFIRAQAGPDYLFSHDDLRKSVASTQAATVTSDDENSELLYSAALYFLQNGTCSINGLQNNFGLGFNRAQGVVKSLEELGIVSPKNATKSREVLVHNEAELNAIFERGNGNE